NTIDGIDELRSITKEGLSSLVIQFVLEKPRDIAAQDVRDKVAGVLAQLPVGTDPPVIEKFDVDAVPVMSIAISGRRNLREVTELARKQVKEDIETLSGVGQVILLGGQERAINVYVDPDRLTAQGLSIGQVRSAIQQQNLELPGGRLDQTRRELVVRTMGRIEHVPDFNDLIVAHVGDRPLRVRDLGWAEDGVVEPRTLARLNGENAVQLVVRKQSGTNTVEVIDRVKAELARLKAALPDDVEMRVIRDQSRFIKASLDTVRLHLWLGAALVAFTVLLFMRDWRSTLVAFMAGRVGRFFHSFGLTVAVAIMISLLISFTLTPSLSARVLRRLPPERAHGGRLYRAFEAAYGRLLAWSLRHRWAIVLLALGTVLSTVPLIHVVGKTFLPQDDQSEFEIDIQTPGGFTLAETSRIFGEIEHHVRHLRGVT